MSFIGGHKIQQLFEDVRTQISDDAHLYTDTFLLSALNSAIHILAMEKDLERMFKVKYQAELATINKDGTRAARWTLDLDGELVGKERFSLIAQDDCYTDVTPCYKSPREFFKCYRFPENNTQGHRRRRASRPRRVLHPELGRGHRRLLLGPGAGRRPECI